MDNKANSLGGNENITATNAAKKCSKCGCDGFLDTDNDDECDNSQTPGSATGPFCNHSKADHTRS
jgi:hypothetical protein